MATRAQEAWPIEEHEDMVTVELGTVVDFTKARKGSRPQGRVIDVCPECGEKGERTIYSPDKQGRVLTNYTHKAKYRGWCWSVEADWHHAVVTEV